MKAIVCEMCDSRDVVKQDDIYVCQNCGTKYEAEAARKLLIEIADGRDERVERLRTVARQSFEVNDYATAFDYFQQLLAEVPDDWEAFFCSAYAKTMTCKIAGIEAACYQLANVLQKTMRLIDASDLNENQKAATVHDIAQLVVNCGGLMSGAAKKHYYDFPGANNALREFAKRHKAAMMLMVQCGVAIDAVFRGRTQIFKDRAVETVKCALEYNKKETFGSSEIEGKCLSILRAWQPKYVENYITDSLAKLKEAQRKRISRTIIMFGITAVLALLFAGYFYDVVPEALSIIAVVIGVPLAFVALFHLLIIATSAREIRNRKKEMLGK